MSIIVPQNAGFIGESSQLRRSFQPQTQKNEAVLSTSVEQYQKSAKDSPFASAMADAQKAKPMPLHGSTPSTNSAHDGQSSARVSALQAMSESSQRMHQATMDKQQLQTLSQLSQSMGKSDSLLDVARNDVGMRNMRTVMNGFNMSSPVAPMADSIKAGALAMQHRTASRTNDASTLTFERTNKVSLKQDTPITFDGNIGKLSQQFESGKDGISAIGYDRTGGTSYGKYQIASKVGSMDNFLNFLDTNAPDIAAKLRESGPSNTGSRQGAMPDMWRQIASEEPARFEELQEKFIYDSHYKPAVSALRQRSGIDGDAFSPAMQEVLFSTAVQHGPTGAARIFANAAAQSGSAEADNFDARFINNIYDIRSEQFGASTAAVQESARNRMQKEKGLALAMLNEDNAIA